MDELFRVLSHIPFGDIGFGGLVILAVALLFRGDIVPKSTLDKLVDGRDAIINAKDRENTVLKEAYDISEKARAMSAEADRELLELGRTTVHLLESIHEKAREANT